MNVGAAPSILKYRKVNVQSRLKPLQQKRPKRIFRAHEEAHLSQCRVQESVPTIITLQPENKGR